MGVPYFVVVPSIKKAVIKAVITKKLYDTEKGE